MKRKGITFLEQHVEKFVLLAVIAVAGFFAATQFIWRGNTVQIGEEKVPPAKVDSVLREKAVVIQDRLSDAAAPTITPPETTSVLAWVQREITDPLTPPQTETALARIQPIVVPGGGEAAVHTDQQYVVPTLAAAGRTYVDQHVDAIDPEIVDQLNQEHPQFMKEVFGESPETYDLSWTTPFIVLDLKKLRQQLSEADPEGEKLSIPSHWYNDRVYLMDVVLERERRLEDGQWGESMVIAVPPLMPLRDLRSELEDSASPMSIGRKELLLDWLANPLHQAWLIQPDFYPGKGGYWTQPEEPKGEEELSPVLLTIAGLQDQIATLNQTRSKKEAELTELGGPLDRDRDRGRGGGAGGGGPPIPGGSGGGPTLGGEGGSGGGGSEGGTTTRERERERRESEQRRIENRRIKLTSDLRKIDERIDIVRANLTRVAEENGIQLFDEDESEALADLEKDDTALVWAHDPTVVPGETYRYRITPRIYNPFFGKAVNLVESQKELADRVTMDVQPGEWSEPIHIKPRTRFFVTSAAPEGGMLDLGEAKFDVFRIHDGTWYQKSYTLSPGDPIGQREKPRDAEHMIDYRTDAYLLDVLTTPESVNVGIGQMRSGGEVVVVFADGTTVTRSPERDFNDSERLSLSASSKEG